MNHLIPVGTCQIGGQAVPAANARDLHSFLEVGKDFSTWIKDRIDQYAFVEHQDFEVFTEIGENLRGGRPIKEYVLTLDMAKELSMVERNAKGKQARQYFIECERRLHDQTGPAHTPEAAPKLVGELAIMECFTRLLRPAPSSQVAMLQHIAKNHRLDTSFLPAYVVDAAPDAPAGSAMPTASLTALLKEHGITTNVAVYNALLRDAGMIEERTRASRATPTKTKHFWAITDRGLAYGKNLTNPASPRETQPHWYTSRFAELHGIVTGRLLGKGGAA
ncbi:antA/AntB antirepressor family protein [Achromobacter sp. ACM04]|uniref:antA/AntB antirepressor family protein n=1 Tax=Achromobacter sp. ACM04 TaxID=2769312 RepID=UPI001786D33F|nr:antA/AntB antirepressor family protein [Achromobacter sp. ACM04]MBD9419844.1 antA/AntB antirepressor family protein [Achromobacter sp. ACM04]